jgi:hypothetical protein
MLFCGAGFNTQHMLATHCITELHPWTMEQIITEKKYLIICKCNKGKSPEWFWNEDIHHFSILTEELLQLFSSHVLCTTPNKHLSASQRLIWALLVKSNTIKNIRNTF